HNYDVGFLLDKLGVAVRTGHHCAQPLMDRDPNTPHPRGPNCEFIYNFAEQIRDVDTTN
ncbi:MAG: aminotransferase class V-fold PLP-dependent enzyme, partial [Muribaculaceae bacterium]|nr:aminotransferase class V-fold PLP-dependent enzyme [Muribaculaceae bacterium]